MSSEKLVAACGLYCGACEMYRSIKDNDKARQQRIIKSFNTWGRNITEADFECEGCLGGGKLWPHCRECDIRSCPKHKPGEEICSPDCEDFPCSLLTKWSNTGFAHHKEIIDNLRRLHKVGIKKYAKEEEKRWLCPKCKTPMSWYYQKCYKCGAERSKKLYEAPEKMFYP